MALAEPSVRMLGYTDLRNWRCRAAGAGLCGGEGAAGLGAGGTGHCVPPTLPATQLSVAGAVTSKQNCSSSCTPSHPTVRLSTRHYAHGHSYPKDAQTFKLLPSQP